MPNKFQVVGLILFVGALSYGKPTLAAEAQPGATRVNSKDGLTYVWIPPGRFIMGCNPADKECTDLEKPAHQVFLTRGFWIGQTEVTQEAYQRVIGNNPSQFQGSKLLPVERIRWDEAAAYCKQIGGRLPTEAEWEYAARAGNQADRYADVTQIAWYDENSEKRTHEVGRKMPNTWGLYDTLGNVWEWVQDRYAPYSAENQQNPHGPRASPSRILRGGAWYDNSRFIREPYRTAVALGFTINAGVRCASDWRMPER